MSCLPGTIARRARNASRRIWRPRTMPSSCTTCGATCGDFPGLVCCSWTLAADLCASSFPVTPPSSRHTGDRRPSRARGYASSDTSQRRRLEFRSTGF
jgi:hypothetical protein